MSTEPPYERVRRVRQELERQAARSGTGFAMRAFLTDLVDGELQLLEAMLDGTLDGSGYDPVPDVAALIDGLLAVAAAGTGPDHHYHSALVQALTGLLAGSYARLRGGLRLDEPGLEGLDTKQAVYRAISAEVRWAPYREFGIPDPAAESFEPPPGPVLIKATGYRGYAVIIYWERETGHGHDS